MIKEDKDYNKVLDILSDLTIDMSSLMKNVDKTLKEQTIEDFSDDNDYINISNLNNEFIITINYAMQFAYNLYAEYYNENISSRYVIEKLIILMNFMIENRSKHHLGGFEYETTNSILNILIQTFTKINYD